VIVALEEDHPQIVLTDGFHFSEPRNLNFEKPGYFSFEVETPLSDWRLFKGGVLLSFLYLLAMLTGFLFLKIVSFIPILVVLMYYYVYRRSFLRLKPVKLYRRQ